MATVAAWAAARDAPLHLHLSEQRAENEACLAATGRTPAALASSAGVLGPRTTAVHATHLTGEDVARLGATGTTACFCPTTERDLADGIGPARALADAGSPLCLGSDSHAVIDLFEEARAVELDERLATERRGHHRPADLLAAATGSGMDALGWDAGRLAPGRLADLVTVRLDSVRLAGARPADAVDHLVFAATAADVTSVVAAAARWSPTATTCWSATSPPPSAAPSPPSTSRPDGAAQHHLEQALGGGLGLVVDPGGGAAAGDVDVEGGQAGAALERGGADAAALGLGDRDDGGDPDGHPDPGVQEASRVAAWPRFR